MRCGCGRDEASPQSEYNERTTTTSPVVMLSDTENVELLPPSYSEIFHEGLSNYGQASNYVKSDKIFNQLNSLFEI